MAIMKDGNQEKFCRRIEKFSFSFYNEAMKNLVLGILAHVDAGKTTLSESILYASRVLRKKGRVDHQNSFLDFDEQEKDRGITIFSSQARFDWKETHFTLIDTPGHIDFSSEMERSLSVLDVAVLTINGCDGVQSHTKTIWKLLRHYQIPTFLFVNKMDITPFSKEELLEKLNSMDENIVDVSENEQDAYEHLAMMSDEYLEKYMNHDLSKSELQEAFQTQKIFPCVFGSALKDDHVERLLDLLSEFPLPLTYSHSFKAKAFKITHEENKRWVHMKILGGCLKVKEKIGEDKVDQIRLYTGSRYESVQEVHAGEICAASGLDHIQIHDTLGYDVALQSPQLTSYMKYRMILPEGSDVFKMMKNLQALNEEDPQLHIRYNETTKQIELQLMGEVQIEILKNIIQTRFDETVEFDQGEVVYLETIKNTVEGVGHFEPLRHYAEVHVLLEPLQRGQGIVIENRCSEDVLSKNWQHLILERLKEKDHKGVLTGSSITDMRITLLSGKAHLKHTEGGDFTEATIRAVRQGLRRAESVLLEPYVSFVLQIPSSCMSKAIYDIEMRQGSFQIEENEGEMCVLTGKAPAKKMQDYALEVINYTKGTGRLECMPAGYDECKDAEDIIQQKNYAPDRDLENPCDSLFCQNGAKVRIPWDEVEKHMHLKSSVPSAYQAYQANGQRKVDDAEVLRIFEKISPPKIIPKPKQKLNMDKVEMKTSLKKQAYLVDGYNIIHDWDELREISLTSFEAARDRLIDLLSNYQGYKNCLLILVFDAYKVKENPGTSTYNGAIHIVYTKTAQTADAYIEKTVKELALDYQVSVATSDGLEQLIVLGQNARRISAREFEKDVRFVFENGMKEYQPKEYRNDKQLMSELREKMEEEE